MDRLAAIALACLLPCGCANLGRRHRAPANGGPEPWPASAPDDPIPTSTTPGSVPSAIRARIGEASTGVADPPGGTAATPATPNTVVVGPPGGVPITTIVVVASPNPAPMTATVTLSPPGPAAPATSVDPPANIASTASVPVPGVASPKPADLADAVASTPPTPPSAAPTPPPLDGPTAPPIVAAMPPPPAIAPISTPPAAAPIRPATSRAAVAAPAGRPVATVGAEVISLPALTGAVKGRLALLPPGRPPSRSLVIKTARSSLESLIEASLVMQEARRQYPDPAALDAALARADAGWPSGELARAVRREGASGEADLRARLAGRAQSLDELREMAALRSLAEQMMRREGRPGGLDDYLAELRRRTPIRSVMSPAQIAAASGDPRRGAGLARSGG